MVRLEHIDISDREKLFYEIEGKLVELSGSHFRGMAAIAATEMGFIITALTLAGISDVARSFVGAHLLAIQVVSVLLLGSAVAGSLQGYLMSLAMHASSLSSFMPDHVRVLISRGGPKLSELQGRVIENNADVASAKNMKRFDRYTELYIWCGRIATVCFLAANGAAVWLIFNIY